MGVACGRWPGGIIFNDILDRRFQVYTDAIYKLGILVSLIKARLHIRKQAVIC